MPFKLDKRSSIRRSGEYRLVYQDGVKYPGRYLVLFHSGQAETGAARVGITVSGKVGIACERNRAKRRIKEAVRAEFGEVMPAGSFVFVAIKRIKDASFDDIRKDVRTLLKRVGK